MKKKIGAILALLVFLAAELALPAAAANLPDFAPDSGQNTLTISHVYHKNKNEELPLQGVSFYLYDISDFTLTNGSIAYPIHSQFANAGVDLSQATTSSQLAAMGVKLYAYAVAKKIAPLQSGISDKNGQVQFTGLSYGVYLLMGEDLVDGQYVYQASPVLIMIPTLDESTNTWLYDVIADTKPTMYDPTTPTPPTTSNPPTTNPPTTNPPTTNPPTTNPPVTRPPMTHPPVTRPPGSPTPPPKKKHTVRKRGITIEDDDVPLGALPQTGQLWWPVPLLAVAGVGFFSLGWWESYGKKHEE